MGWCACCSTPKELQLFDAVKTNNRVRVHQLLREAVDLHRIEVDNVGSTLLHVAGQLGHAAVIEELCELAQPEYINKRNSHGFTALHEAAINGRSRAVAALVEAGAAVDREGPSRSTPLHLACSRGNNSAVRALITGGANLESHGWNEERPLHMAARKGRRETCMLLLELGADPDALDGIGRRPWQVAETAFGGLTAPKNAQGVKQTLAWVLKPENVATAAMAEKSEDERIVAWIHHSASCRVPPEATEPSADDVRDPASLSRSSSLVASTAAAARLYRAVSGQRETARDNSPLGMSFDSILSTREHEAAEVSTPSAGGGVDERVSAWEHGAHTMLHVTTAIPRTLALGHIACHLNGAADVAVLQVAIKAMGPEPHRTQPDAGVLRQERMRALSQSDTVQELLAENPLHAPVTNPLGAHLMERSLSMGRSSPGSLPSPAQKPQGAHPSHLLPLDEAAQARPPLHDVLLKSALEPVYGELLRDAASQPASPTAAQEEVQLPGMAPSSASFLTPPPRQRPLPHGGRSAGAAGLAEEEEEEAVSPSSPATLPLSPGPGLFRCTYVLVDGITGGPLSRKHAHALREEVTRVVAAAHEAYPEAAAMLSLHLGLHRRATLSPLPSRTPTQLPADIEDPDHLFDSTVM